MLESRILKINPDNLSLKERLLSTHVNSLRDAKKSDKAGRDKAEKSKKGGGGGPVVVGLGGGGGATPTGAGGGGTDSASTSRASTPVSDRFDANSHSAF